MQLHASIFAALLVAAAACNHPADPEALSSTADTGAAVASCADECRDFYDCHFSLCLLQGGATCSTQRIDGLESCERLTEDECTPSLLAEYDACEASDSDASSSAASAASSEDDGSSGWDGSSSGWDGSSSGWGDSSSGGAGSSTGAVCLPGNSFCDYDFECCSNACDDAFDFCH